MKTGSTLARFAALLGALAGALVAHADATPGCEGPNHYILSKCRHELRLEWMAVPDSLFAHQGGHAATLLEDGRVLVVGGGEWRYDAATRASWAEAIGAETYDPATRTWSPTAPMNVARMGDVQAVRLLDGRVLVLGGETFSDGLQGSAEIFDPSAGVWTPTASPAIPRLAFTATLLANGEVLVAGGVNPEIDRVAAAEIYSPESGTWRTAGRLLEPRWVHAATAMPDGRVLVSGGYTFSDDFNDVAAVTAEMFDPATETWHLAGHVTQGLMHTVTPLGDGSVLVAGGTHQYRTRRFDPHSGIWLDTGRLKSHRHGHFALPIPGQGVLVVGGVDVSPVARHRMAPVERLELFDGATGRWQEVAATNEPPTSPSNYHSATKLADGTWLLIGDAEGMRAVQLRY